MLAPLDPPSEELVGFDPTARGRSRGRLGSPSQRVAYVEDTIAAIATARGPGAVAIVRVSGPSAFDLARRLCTSPGGREPDLSESHRARLARVRDPSGRVVDDVLLLPMKGPRSYTGEDVVEIQCHGGSLVPRLVLAGLLRAGAREARPGEFTQRAFLNGRMDLCQAEAVADLVAASSEPALVLARNQLDGRLSDVLAGLRDRLLDARALVEAHLDFPEDDLPADAGREIEATVADAIEEIRVLQDGFARARLAREGARVVLVGKPNVGKSSLLNALLGRERALVSAEPGTTRDFLEEPVAIGAGGFRILLVDTAGLREAGGEIERAGIERTRELVCEGDAVVAVLDASNPLDRDDLGVLEIASDMTRRGIPCLLAANKADLIDAAVDDGSWPPAWRSPDGSKPLPTATRSPILVSATSGRGLGDLCSALDDALAALVGDGRPTPVAIGGERHRVALEGAAAALLGIGAGTELEIVAQALQACVVELEGLLGASTSEEVLDRVFERFCIGK